MNILLCVAILAGVAALAVHYRPRKVEGRALCALPAFQAAVILLGGGGSPAYLLLQAALMALFAIFVSYNMFGRNYGAAVMAAGNCGWGCGSGPNAVANEKAVMDQYGWHNVAWVLYPSFAVIIDDIYNPIFLSVFGGLLAH